MSGMRWKNNYDKGYTLVTNDYGETWTEVRPMITGSGTEWKEALVNLEDYIGSGRPSICCLQSFTLIIQVKEQDGI